MKRGDIVKYSRPVNQEEAAFRFILLNEPEKGRVDIQLTRDCVGVMCADDVDCVAGACQGPIAMVDSGIPRSCFSCIQHCAFDPQSLLLGKR